MQLRRRTFKMWPIRLMLQIQINNFARYFPRWNVGRCLSSRLFLLHLMWPILLCFSIVLLPYPPKKSFWTCEYFLDWITEFRFLFLEMCLQIWVPLIFVFCSSMNIFLRCSLFLRFLWIFYVWIFPYPTCFAKSVLICFIMS